MPLSQEEKERILQAVQQRVSQLGKCAICGHGQWTLADGYVVLSVQDNLAGALTGGLPIGARGIPCVAIVCNHCGNTQLINVIALGLQDLLQKALASRGSGL